MFIKRDGQGAIVEVVRFLAQGAEGYESVPEDHPDLVAYYAARLAEQQAREARISTDDNERLALMGDAAIANLVNATPEQILTWAQNNSPLTPANLARILYILAVAVRPHVR